MYSRSILAVALIMLITSATQAEDNQLRDRLQIPKQGHLEFLSCVSCKVKGLSLTSEEDVLALHQKIADIPFDEDLIISFKLLEKIGLEKLPRPVVPPPPGGTGKIVQLPEWQHMVVDFDESRYVQRQDTIGDREWIYSVSPECEVEVHRSPRSVQVNHYDADVGASIFKKDIGEVLARTVRDAEASFESADSKEREVCVVKKETYTRRYFTQPGKDLIEVQLLQDVEGRIFRSSLQFYHAAPAESGGIWLPRLTCSIQRQGNDVYLVKFYILQDAKLDKPLDDAVFRVSVNQGDMYVHRTGKRNFAARIPALLDNIADKNPLFVRGWIQEKQTRLVP